VISALAVVFSVIGAYYYLRVIKLMYFDEISDYAPIVADYEVRLVLTLNAVLLLLLGLFPARLISYCGRAMGL
jgi:NADH-quinone oxidoreductase subunit N